MRVQWVSKNNYYFFSKGSKVDSQKNSWFGKIVFDSEKPKTIFFSKGPKLIRKNCFGFFLENRRAKRAEKFLGVFWGKFPENSAEFFVKSRDFFSNAKKLIQEKLFWFKKLFCEKTIFFSKAANLKIENCFWKTICENYFFSKGSNCFDDSKNCLLKLTVHGCHMDVPLCYMDDTWMLHGAPLIDLWWNGYQQW